ncbi:hypothetical protein [Pseudomonas guariconensis]|uniref:hypothetical protein n=1 Tax=Pseudomonas guariconensis TaxID=1288410 RepID=UPI002E21FA56
MTAASAAQTAPAVPRILRAGKAPAYLGMSRAEFNKTVRPYVSEFPIGERGIGFDRQELDAWATDYILTTAIAKQGAKGTESPCSERHEGGNTWREKQSRASRRGTASGTSTRGSTVSDFTKALALAKGKKRSAT